MSDVISGIPLTERLLADYALRREALHSDNPMVQAWRDKAAEAFRKTGFPARKDEEYRYIPFDKFLRDLSHPLSGPEKKHPLKAPSLIDPEAPLIVLRNGYFSPSDSRLEGLEKGLHIESLQGAIACKNTTALAHLSGISDVESDPLLSLNSALFQDGVFVHIAKGAHLNKPVQIFQHFEADEPSLIQPRVLVVAEENSEANFVHLADNNQTTAAFLNCAIEVCVLKSARITLAQVFNQPGLSATQHTEAQVHRDAVFSHYSFSLQGKLLRNTLNVVLSESHCEAHLYGFYHPSKDELFDSHTLVDHRMPNCQSNELYKGVVSDNGTAVFNGKVYVRQDAQKTNAYQSNKNILMSEEATVNTKPQLEIYADDVKCSHGSSTGVIDPEQLFYLRSRGITTQKAKSLLLQAYAGEILEQVPTEHLRLALTDILHARFSI